MFEKFKQNWKWLATIAVSIAAVIPAWMVMYPSDGKELSYELKSVSSLITTDIGSNGALKLVYEDSTVSYPYLTVVKIENTGTLPILKSDFDGPINITLGSNIKILDISILEKKPEAININISENDEGIHIAPTLLNSKDFITIKIITGGVTPTPNVIGRIAGVTDIYQFETTENPAASIVIQIICFLLILSFSVVQTIIPRAFVNRCNKRKLAVIKSRTAWFFVFPPFAGMIFSVSYLSNKLSFGTWGAVLSIFIIIVFGELLTKTFNLNLPRDYKLCESNSTLDSEKSI